MRSVEPVIVGWIFRPERADNIEEHVGKQVRSVGKAVDDEGRVAVVLSDGTCVRAYRHEVVVG
ncbi:hypothetical protein ABZ570_29390 [Micromonospora sp. NPDC007271]|uniref:hypothetical protein n=1 Tax=Micromonospora sp. NPDC007271 TaxID=3154587 RepID=UPI0033FA5DEE